MAKVTLKASNIDILNNVRSLASNSYKERIPVATQANMNELANGILSQEYEQQRNELVNALVNRIGFVFIQNKNMWENPLKKLKKGFLNYGSDVEEIFVEMAKAKEFSAERSSSEVFKREYPDIKVMYHRLDRRNTYKVTISREQLSTAFIDETGLSDLIARQMDGLYRGAEYDEYLVMKNLFQEAWEKNNFYPVIIDNPTDTSTMKKAVTQIRAMTNKIGFYSTEYNPMKVNTFTKKDRVILFVTPEFEALMDVEVLAVAFNMSKTDFISRVIVVDNLGDETMSNCVCALVDEDWFMIWDRLFESGSIYNPEGMYWNNTLQVWQLLSTSKFCNAIMFVTNPTVVSVAISPKTASLKRGEMLDFTVVVDGDGSNNVVWTITGTTSENTYILNNVLFVGSDETASSLTIKATSFYDKTKSDTATITITDVPVPESE